MGERERKRKKVRRRAGGRRRGEERRMRRRRKEENARSHLLKPTEAPRGQEVGTKSDQVLKTGMSAPKKKSEIIKKDGVRARAAVMGINVGKSFAAAKEMQKRAQDQGDESKWFKVNEMEVQHEVAGDGFETDESRELSASASTDEGKMERRWGSKTQGVEVVDKMDGVRKDDKKGAEILEEFDSMVKATEEGMKEDTVRMMKINEKREKISWERNEEAMEEWKREAMEMMGRMERYGKQRYRLKEQEEEPHNALATGWIEQKDKMKRMMDEEWEREDKTADEMMKEARRRAAARRGRKRDWTSEEWSGEEYEEAIEILEETIEEIKTMRGRESQKEKAIGWVMEGMVQTRAKESLRAAAGEGEEKQEREEGKGGGEQRDEERPTSTRGADGKARTAVGGANEGGEEGGGGGGREEEKGGREREDKKEEEEEEEDEEEEMESEDSSDESDEESEGTRRRRVENEARERLRRRDERRRKEKGMNEEERQQARMER